MIKSMQEAQGQQGTLPKDAQYNLHLQLWISKVAWIMPRNHENHTDVTFAARATPALLTVF